MPDDWLPLSTVAFALAYDRGKPVKAEWAAQLELITDLAGEVRKAAGFSRSSGEVEAVPWHFFTHAEPGEGLDWADRDPFMTHKADVIVDFRCDALGIWDLNLWEGAGGYRVRYSDIRVSRRLVTPPELLGPGVLSAPQKPAYGKIPEALKAAAKAHEKELLAMPTQAAKADFLANVVGCSESSAIRFLQGK